MKKVLGIPIASGGHLHMGLASRHDGVNAALMRTLEDKKVDPRDY